MTFAYDGERIELVSEQKVIMILPDSHPLDTIKTTTGFSVILRDANEAPLYRRVMENPIRHDTEVFSQDKKETIRRIPVDKPKGAFVVLVPDFPSARSIEFFGRPLRPLAHLEPPRRLASFALRPSGVAL